MKAVIALACPVFVAVAKAERCVSASDCKVVSCATGSSVICERQECMCAAIQQACRVQSDCPTTRCINWLASWHCVDNVCRCIQL